MSEGKENISRRSYIKYAGAAVAVGAVAAAGYGITQYGQRPTVPTATTPTTPRPTTPTPTPTPTPTGERKVRVLTFGSAQTATQQEIDELFTKETGIKVEATVTGNTYALHAKIVADWIAGRTSYDVIQTQPPGLLVEFILRDYLQPMDDMAEELKKKCIPNLDIVWEANTYNGHLWGVPQNLLQMWLFWYRTDIFQRAGISKPPETWEELAEVAKKCTLDLNGDGKPDVYGLLAGFADDKLWINFGSYFNQIFHKGFDKYNFMFSSDMKKCTMNDEGAIKALEFMKALLPYMNPESINVTSTGAGGNIFRAGTPAMYFNHPYQYFWNKDPEKSKIVDKWGMALCPGSQFAGKKSFTTLSPCMYSITKKAMDVDAAKKYVMWWNSEGFHEWNIKKYQHPTWLKSLFDKYKSEFPHWTLLEKQLQQPYSLQFLSPADPDIWKRFEVYFQKFIAGQMDAKTALDKYVGEANTILATL